MAILSNVKFNLAMHMSLVLTMLMVRVMIGQYVARKCRANHQRNHCWVMHEKLLIKQKKETIGLICFMPLVVNERNRSAALECVGSVVQPLLVVDFDANWAISTDWF
ncbi:Uncharacterised protein [Vibrio cholerae]|nr:Uncharacterised protein [Vibrio cholerae]